MSKTEKIKYKMFTFDQVPIMAVTPKGLTLL